MTDWLVYADVEITRRKRFHIVIDPSGERAWIGRNWTDCIDWLNEQGVQRFALHPDRPGKRYRVSIETY